jgi:hypothetical protein
MCSILCHIGGFTNKHEQALTGERINDQCFVCGPKGNHYQPLLPPHPEEWNFFINDRKTPNISRKLNNLLSLTVLGVYDGDFMKFPDGMTTPSWYHGLVHRPSNSWWQKN